jgi:hypothetical protein
VRNPNKIQLGLWEDGKKYEAVNSYMKSSRSGRKAAWYEVWQMFESLPVKSKSRDEDLVVVVLPKAAFGWFLDHDEPVKGYASDKKLIVNENTPNETKQAIKLLRSLIKTFQEYPRLKKYLVKEA